MTGSTSGKTKIELKPGITTQIWSAGAPAFAVVLVLFAALYIPLIPAMFNEIIMSYSFSQNLLFPVIAAGLLWYERKRLAEVVRRRSNAGLALAAIALCVYAAALGGGKFVTARYSMLFAGLGAALWFYGPEKLKRAWAPVLLIFLTVPIHPAVTAKIIVPLTTWDRLAAARAVVWFVKLIGVPAWRDGFDLHVPGAVLNVAITCSGLNFVTSLFMLSAIVIYICGGSLWRKTLFLLLMPFAGLAANTARITANLLVAYKLGASEGFAFFHNYGALVFNLLALAGAITAMKITGLSALPETEDLTHAERQQ